MAFRVCSEFSPPTRTPPIWTPAGTTFMRWALGAAALGALAARVHQAGGRTARLRLLRRRGRGRRGEADRPARRAGLRAAEQVPLLERPPDGRGLSPRRRARGADGRGGTRGSPAGGP